MNTITKLDQELRKGRDADRVLNDPLFQEAFHSLEASLIDKMRRVAMGDRDTQHELVLSLQLLGSLKRYFTELLETGKMAEIQKDSNLKDSSTRIVRR